MSPGSSSKRKDSPSFPSVNEFGYPLDKDGVTPVASSAHNSLGESSNNRSMGGMAFLAPPPLMSRSAAGISLKTSSSIDGFGIMPPQLKRSTIGRKPTPSVSSESATWKIPEGSVRPKPPAWPLDPMSKMIMHSNAQSIAERISDCLKRRNISVSYGDEKAKAKCVSQDRVEFRIRLFAGVGKFEGGVIVEVQRRNGWASSYSQDCHAILESAECDSVGDSDDALLIDVKTYCTFCHVQKKSKKSKLLLSKSLLFSSRQESLLLGLENIHSLTNPRKYGHEMVQCTAQSLFLDQDNESVKEILRELVTEKRWNGKDLSRYSESVEQEVTELVLGTFTNCISILVKNNMLSDVLNANKWIEDEFVAVIMQSIDNNSSPYKAARATRCLSDITEASARATNKAIQMGILSVLEKN